MEHGNSIEDLYREAAALESGPVRPGPETKPVDIKTAEILRPVLSQMFAIMAPGWQVSVDESNMLADAYADVIDKYFPDLDLGVEFNAVIVTIMVIGPRRKLPRHAPDQKPVKPGTPDQKPVKPGTPDGMAGKYERDE